MVGEGFGFPLPAGEAPGGEEFTTQIVAAAAPSQPYVNGPQAVYDPATHRTYLAYLGLERDMYVTYVDHLTGVVATPVEVGAYPLPDNDNHGAPTLAIDHDGFIHVVWGGHGTAHQHSKSGAAHDISAWTTQALSAGTYPHLVVAPNGDLLIFDRPGTGYAATYPSNAYLAVRRSTNGGTSWSDAAIVDANGTPETDTAVYCWGAELVDDLVHLTWTLLRGGGGGTREDLYHATYNPADGTLAALDGTDLGTLIDWTDHATVLAVDYSPVIVARPTVVSADEIYVVWQTDDGGAVWTLKVSRWGGSAWSTVDAPIASTDTPYGVVKKWGDTLLLLAGERRAGSYNDLTVYVSHDLGTTWEPAGAIAEGDTGEGYQRVNLIGGGGPWWAITQQAPTGFADTSATSSDLTPVTAVIGRDLTEEYVDTAVTAAITDHNADPDAHPDLQIDLPNETVFAPTYTVTDGTTLDLDVTFVWGIDSAGDPYYNAAGVTAGDEAVLVLDNTTSEFSLRPVEI